MNHPHTSRLATLLCIAGVFTPTLAHGEMPTALEPGKEVSLFAKDPDIVTPVGMAIDEADRIYVIESHTHGPPKDYTGPDRDRIKLFVDDNNDGKADSVEIFAEGLNQAMNLAFGPDGALYALCAKELVALPDRDGDGKCDGLEIILRLETKSGNAHGNWLGIAFDPQGKVYLGRGNVGSHIHRVVGKDGSAVEGYGDGGSVIRANPDGTEVEPWATGFWNPMSFIYDRRDRLIMVDNDPDGRGPNRLLEVVEGGDYGYKSVFGGWGRHPFQGWDGSLPGTLPFISGTGEAPSGVIDASIDSNDSYLATIWNENTIERHTVIDDRVEKTLFMSGGKDFRPVALAYDSRGNLFITDWVLVDYPNHGKGRIWRVSNTPRPKHLGPLTVSDPPNNRSIKSFLNSDDLFIRHRGEMWLSESKQRNLAQRLIRDNDPLVRLGAYLALRRAGETSNYAHVKQALSDPDKQVRRIALMWAAEQLDPDLRSALDTSLEAGPVDSIVFEAYLASVEVLQPDFASAYRNRENDRAYRIPRSLDSKFIETLAWSADIPAEARALALERLGPDKAFDFLTSDESAVRLAAIRMVSQTTSEEAENALMEIALSPEEQPDLRAEALLGLSRQAVADPERLIPLLENGNKNLAIEATRTLRLHSGNSTVRNALSRGYAKWAEDPSRSEQAEVAEFALHGFDPNRPFGKKRPQDIDTWKRVLAERGNPGRGSRVFRSQQSLCISCHSLDGQGTEFGPPLTGIAQSLSREAIIHSILRPSDSFSPDYQAWIIKTKDGNAHQGVQIDHQSKGAMLLYTLNERENVRFTAEEIVDYEASKYSLMPPGLENTMTVSEFRDLIAYLTSFE